MSSKKRMRNELRYLTFIALDTDRCELVVEDRRRAYCDNCDSNGLEIRGGIRLQNKVVHEVSKLSSTDLPPTVQQQHSFAITVADNFDMNIGTLRGENSIRMLNRIIIQTPANDELKSDVNECLNDLCASVVSAVDESDHDLLLNSNTTNSRTFTTSSTTNENEPYISYKDNSYRDLLLAYTLMKYVYAANNIFQKFIDNQMQINLPLLSGFFATYLPHVHRPLSKITFLSPTNQDPSSLTTSQLCLQSTKASLIDSRYQKEAVVVVDEKIYSNCIKAKWLNETDNKSIFCYPGDFHIMKNYMIVIWDVLNGSGIEDVLGCIYKAAAHRAIMNVHNFNYSLRCCKLIYTALSILFFESFIKTLSASSTTTNHIIIKLKEILKCIPSYYAVQNKRQEWFSTLLNEIDNLKVSDALGSMGSRTM
ncbi:unnamed protein product [Rotaria sordida]|uniref:Uncharacterized protein n=1 Tax=Rotaria sordida TaxID=392033 RepID=A0A814XAD8_9BILA|nr:unnamed protein product [Rotaria sordida]CAF1259915.1 unnamed protein product [Rotaria sordida]